MALSSKTGLYVAREPTPGSPQAATIAFPTKMTFEEKPDYSYPEEDRDSSDENWVRVTGTKHVEWDAKGSWYNDECGYILLNFFGLPVSTSTLGAFQHVWTPLDTPEALTMYKYLNSDTAQLPMAYTSEIKLSYDAANKPIEFDTKGIAQKATFGQSKPTPTMSGSNKPFSGWLPVVRIGGSSVGIVNSAEFTLSRPLAPFYNLGSQFCSKVYFGKRVLKGKMTVDFTDETYLNNFRQDTESSLQFTATGYAIGSGANNTLDVTIPRFNFDTCKFDYSKANIMLQFDFTALHDSVTGRLLQMTTTNITSGYTS